MISIIEEDRVNNSFLLQVVNLSLDQLRKVYSAIKAEGDSEAYECGDYWMVVVNDDYTTWDQMSVVIHGLMDEYNQIQPIRT